jgi:GT2 family glycosyltransferase
VLTDDAAAAYKARPLIPQDERLRIIKALRCVDEAYLQHAQDPTEDLQRAEIRPDYLVHGDDWDYVPGGEYVRSVGGRTVILPHTEGISSTIIKLGGDTRKPPAKVVPGGVEYAVCIPTFLRERTLFRTVAEFQKNLEAPFRFYIADDSGRKTDRKLSLYQDLRKHGATIIDKPFDVGLSVKRNALVKAATEPYIFLTDDDIMIDDQLALDRMRAVLDARPDIGLVAALVKNESGSPFTSDGYAHGLRLEKIGRMLKRTAAPRHLEKAPMRDGTDTLYMVVDQPVNCFLARAEIFDGMEWDARIKVEFEHMDWFIRLKEAGRWKSAVAVEAEAKHVRSDPDMEYERVRRSYSPAYFKQKHGIENIVNQF